MSKEADGLSQYRSLAEDEALVAEVSLAQKGEEEGFEDHDIDPKIVKEMYQITKKALGIR